MIQKKVLWSETIRSRVERGGPHFLARASLRAFSAASGSVLLDIAITDRPDLIVLASEPNEMAAEEICRRLRADERTRSIPILGLAASAQEAEDLRAAGCRQVLDAGVRPQELQQAIATSLEVRLRRHPRYPVVLPVARGRIFHEFLGYTNLVSEGGMGFETISRIRAGEHLPLKIYRNTEERPIAVTGRVAGVRPNIETGIGYAVGIEFLRLGPADRGRLVELFPRDPTFSWGSDAPSDGGPQETPSTPRSA